MPRFMCTDEDCGNVVEAVTHHDAAREWGQNVARAEAGQWNGGDVHVERLDENGDPTGDKETYHVSIDWEPVVNATRRT